MRVKQAGGIVSYAVDAALRTAVFSLAGRVFAVNLETGGPAAPRELPLQSPALEPRPDRGGQRVAYVSGGGARVAALRGEAGADRAVAGPEDNPGVTYGLAEFIAAEEMDRSGVTGGRRTAPRCSSRGSTRRRSSAGTSPDPANPGRRPVEVAYPAAGTPNADVSLVLADLAGQAHSGGVGPGGVPLSRDRVLG